MKKLLIFSLLLFILTITANCQNTDLLWVTQFTGAGQNQPINMVSDASGNSYVIGNFTTTVNQDAFTLNTFGGQDVFFVKYNKNGQVIWLKQIGGTGAEVASSIAISNDGNFVYVSGTTNGTCGFDGNNITTSGLNDIFLAKYSTSGTLAWVHKSAYGAQAQLNGSITIDKDENIVQVGVFNTDVTFYPGTITLVPVLFPAIRQNFIAKYDSSGNAIWAKMIEGDFSTSFFRSISTYEFGYFFSGQWAGNLYTDIGIYASNSSSLDGFLYKTDTAGNGSIFRKINGTTDEFVYRHRSDVNGYQFLTGYYNSPALTVDSTLALTSVQTFPNAGSNDIFYACYAPDGTLQYARSYGSIGDDQGLAVYPNNDHVIIGGQYTGAINFDSFNLTNSGTDAFMVETDRFGTVLSAKRAYGTNTDITKSSNIDVDGNNLFVGEFYSNPLNIEGRLLVPSGGGLRDMFILKFGTITITPTVTNILCNGDTTGQISIAVTGDGTPPYTYLWSNGSINDTIINLAAGWYKVTVTDANLATKVDSAQVTEPSAIAAVFAVTNTLCPTSTDGAINLTPLGGVSPYTYLWSNAAITEDISGLASGWYYITITDINLCTKVDSAQVLNPASMLLTGSVTTPTCIPGGDGAVDLTVFNGTGPYTYLWNDGASSTTQDISSLVSGTYSVTVTDANLCTVTGSYDVINPSAPQVTYTKTDISCVPGNDGAIDVLVSGGTIPYTYSWFDGPLTQDRTGLSAGTYILTVTDAASCSATTATIVLYNPASPSISFVSTNPTCVPGNDGAIDLIVYSGTPAYTYNWTGSLITEDISSLSEGTYTVTVTDSKECTAIDSATIARQFPIATITPNGATTFCDGQNVILQATMASGNTYQWQESGADVAGAVISAYTATTSGNYTVIVNNSNGCADTSAITSVTVNPLPTIYNVTGGGSFCSGGTGVSVGLSSSDLTADYELFLNGVTTSNILAGIGAALDFGLQTSAGIYTIVATDATTSCTSTMNSSATVTVNSLPLATITPNGATTFCDGQNVILQATIAGGNTYQWQESSVDVAGAVSSAYTATTSGNYTVIVNNSDGCADTSSVTTVTVNSLPTLYNVTGGGSYCSGGTGVSVGLPNSDLSVNYELYLNSVTTTNILAGTGVSIDFGLQTLVGTYTIVATDATNCTSTMNSSAVIDTVLPLTGSLNVHTLVIFCASNSNGEATISTQNGLAPLTYIWSAPSTSTGAYANDLGIGVNYVTVTDGCGTQVIDSIVITSLPAMSASIISSSPANCATSTDGSATATATGGIAPYSYTWSGSASIVSTANDLNVGMHYVTISDYCSSIIDSVSISSLPLLSINISTPTQVSCAGANDGSAIVTASDGIPPYSYLWSTSEANDTATMLVDGLNYVTVTDGCGQLISSVIVTTALPLSISISPPSPTNCAGGNNGSAMVTTTNGTGTFTFQWSTNNAFSDTINSNAFATNLINDTNYVKVSDGCTIRIDFVIVASLAPLSTSITFWVSASCINSADGKAKVDISDGAGPFTYLWGDTASSTGFVATDLFPGLNYVTVTDACTTVVDSVDIGVKTPLSASITSQTSTSCASDTDGTAIVTALDGGLPYSYAWSNDTTITGDTATNLPVGNHFVTVTDVCGSVVVPFTIASTQAVSLNISKQNIKCYGQSNGSIIVTPTNGISPYTLVWSDTTLTDSIRTNVGAGTYYITVTDVCGSYSDSVTISTPGALSLSTINTNVSFTGLTDGAIDVIMSGGVQPYYYTWSNLSTSEDLTNIAEGNYSLTVTDENGCIINDSIPIITDSWHIEIYKAFTPNGDGKNDVWNIKHISAFPNCTVTIFNEWGIKVFESTGYTTSWDGKNKNGKILPSATYYYIIDLKDDSKVYTGSVALIK